MDFLSAIKSIAGEECIFCNEMMSDHTTFKVGGPAKYFVVPYRAEDIKKYILAAEEYKIPYYVIGNGSNLLVSDKGYDGMIIMLGRDLGNITVNGDRITAEAGTSLARLFNTARRHSLSGLEFAAGIPGTLGGACYMNAGAYGGEMKDVLTKVVTIDRQGNTHEYKQGEMELSYRNSIFIRKQEIILSAEMKLCKGDVEKMTHKVNELLEKRKEKQPLEYPSAGSTFKRLEGDFAGRLIEECGLKGKGVNGAEVSEKHAGFIINRNNATARDIYDTINLVIDTVLEKTGIKLEPEVRLLGDFSGNT